MSAANSSTRFTHPLPHTALNHFLRQTKSLLASGGLDNEDAVYVLTPPTHSPTLDQVISAISFAYLQQQLDTNSHTQLRYIPIISAPRSTCLSETLPELGLALQAALVGQQNLIFQDDEVYKTVAAYTSKKKVVLVGGATQIKGDEAWQQWCELHGAELFGVIDVENTLPKQIHDEHGGINERLNVTLFPSVQAVRFAGETEPALASLVALWAKEEIAVQQNGSQTVMTQELADLLLSAILMETENLAESKTNSADLGAVGWLNPQSSFALQDQDAATSAEDVDQGQAEAQDVDVNEDEANVQNFDPFVPTFPDLDALYRALRGASRQKSSAKIRATGTTTEEAGAGAGATEAELGDASATHFQWNLITNTLANLDKQTRAKVPEFVLKTIQGDFASVLTSTMATLLFKPIGSALGQVLTSRNGTFDLGSLQKQINAAVQNTVQTQDAGFEALCVAVSCLHAFVQINWTGPQLAASLEPLSLLRNSSPDSFPPRPVDSDVEEKINAETSRLIHRSALEALAFKGEPAYHLCQVPFFLIFSKLLVEALLLLTTQERGDDDGSEGVEAIETLVWWRLRVFTVHSHVLDEPVAFGKKVFDPVNRLRDVLIARSASMTKGEGGKKSAWASLAARLILERGIALQRLGSDREASETFVEAAKVNGLRYRMSGALGKRTKFQKEDKTQLVLLAKSVVVDGGKEDEEAEKQDEAGNEGRKVQDEGESDSVMKEADKEPMETGFAAKANPEDQVAGMPSTYALNDDTLLEQTKFTTTTSLSCTNTEANSDDSDLLSLDPNSQPALAVLDQCTLLALCLNIRNTQASHGLTSNQMSIFITRVLSHPRNWMVHTMSLLLRARLESNRTRTVERSVLQLQALIDQMPTNDSSVEERLKFFHALDLPPKWEMQAELARRYASIGVTRSALEIFERVEMWEDVVTCLGMLGRQEEAREVVRELLEGKKVEADVEVSVRRRNAVESSSNIGGGSGVQSEAQQVMYRRMDRAREAKLWCLLGDLDPSSALIHYTKAWNVSASSSARAARSLGGVYFSCCNYENASKWLKSALNINPLFTRSWFILGCCYMRLEKWKEGAQCFRRCTGLDDEDMESWNNLASCYLRMVEKEESARDVIGVERMGNSVGLPDILEAQEEADKVWDRRDEATFDDDQVEEEEGGSGMSDWSGSSRSDSGVEVSSSSESEVESEQEDGASEADTETGLRNPGQVRNTPTRQGITTWNATTAYSLKLLAHRSLQQSLRFGHDNWRIWYNYMIVCIDVGYLFEATRAMVRVVEIQTRNKSSDFEKAKSVDLAVLSRLVSAVVSVSKTELESRTHSAMEAYQVRKREYEANGLIGKAPMVPKLDSNSGLGLYPTLRRMFDETLLTKISTSAAIWKMYSTLLLWNGEKKKGVETGLLNAYNSAFNAALNAEEGVGDLNADKQVFVALLHDLRNLVDALLDLGKDETRQVGEPKVEFQARSLVRTFLAKTRDSWSQEQEYEEAKELLEQLKS
ncbi:uncharacterized protein MEPE_05833 [Melanopsichium pennsylvanicum]|uniref:TPR-like protein n=2 Tax=Melanopsichium pennsylvanicum TaxID=63383 RepID=A0AAJ4XRT3_9BASI|nr:conserved hypothetical protein [Melanopsichium pennsylvanicum 4]SNX87123.1 uncharacterized protein MEPE_05833 [Melanopsichium pennsylvanicum]